MEDKENKELQPQNLNRSNNTVLNNEVSKLGVVVRSFLGHINENNGIDCNLQLFMDKMQQLEAAWSDNENKFALLQADNKQLQIQLLSEKNKCAVLQKRLQFIQENKGHFEKLKEVYSNMKQMETDKCQSRILIHKTTQSESLMTVSSYATCMLQPEVNETFNLDENSPTVSIQKVELFKAQDTINVLKQLIYRREQTWGLNRDKQKHYVQNVKRLERENSSLRSIVNTHYNRSKEHIGTSMDDVSHNSSISVEVNAVKSTECMSTNTVDDTLLVMERIVRKLENRNRELEQMSKDDSSSNIFSKKELGVLNQIHNLENLNDITSEFFTNNLPTQSSDEPVQSIGKQPTKSASSPLSRAHDRSLPQPVFRLSSSIPAPPPLYPPHPRCYDTRCHEQSYGAVAASSRSKRTEKQLKSGKAEIELPLVMKPGSKEKIELEILKQIKCEILMKQQNINKKLQIFQQGLDRRQKKVRSSKPSSPIV